MSLCRTLLRLDHAVLNGTEHRAIDREEEIEEEKEKKTEKKIKPIE